MTIKLGLIGENILQSSAPDLHRICGQLAGKIVSYELFIPPNLGKSFGDVFAMCQERGLRGVNITLPYKEEVLSSVVVENSKIANLGAINTVLFGDHQPKGFNTDYSGFISAFKVRFTARAPGRVVQFGAGGVGKATAFALLKLGATEIVLVDPDECKATALVKELSALKSTTHCRVGSANDLKEADGVLNCTPLGMHGYDGSPILEGTFPGNVWAFDAVYTPLETVFRKQAEAAGAQFLSGYELFFHQGIQAFEIFTGQKVTETALLRQRLAQ